MNFREKKDTARRIAKVQHIQTYRDLLKARGSSAAGRIILDKEALAQSLVYHLLDYYTEEQILAALPGTRAAASTLPAAIASTVQSVKKKIQRLKNILQSPGPTWTTLWSGLRTAYTRIASTATAFWQRLKERLQRLLSSTVKLFRR